MKTRYIRLLSYYNACKVIEFVNSQDNRNYANITVGGIVVNVPDENWNAVHNFLMSLEVGFEVGSTPPYKIHKRIIEQLKNQDNAK